MKREEVRQLADRLVSQLEKWSREEDRGPLSRLRRGLNENTRCQAWFVLGRLFGPLAVNRPVFETVAGCFALHPFDQVPSVGTFGETMRLTMPDEKMRDPKEPHTRFRRLLACDNQKEICRHIPHAVRLAKSKEASVNYRLLFEDLWWWGDRTKIEWAKAYWQVPEDPPGFSLAGVGSLAEEEGPAPMPEA